MTEYPKISIVSITYGHEKYITQMLDGVFMQVYPGEIEFILANDNSPDSTHEIIKKYLSEKKIPENFKVKYFKHDINKGMMPNFIWALQHASGKYVALCEGDDYWTDSLKLKKQVAFLEDNLKYTIHSGKAQILSNNELKEIIGNPKARNEYDISDFLVSNNLISCTVMYRNTTFPTNLFKDLIFGDWLLYSLLLSEKPGSMAYVADEVFSVYRIHEGGVMQTVNRKHINDESHIKQIFAVKKIAESNFDQKDISKINDYCLSIFQHYFSLKDYKKCFIPFAENLILAKNKMPFRKYVGHIRYNLFT